MKKLVPEETIAMKILLIRGHKVMLDSDLARLYGVTTKRLNEQVKRNRERFPRDFMFQLTTREKAKVVASCDHLGHLKFASTLPYVFTEHGAVMLASVLNSPVAIEASIRVVRVFVRLKQILSSNRKLATKLDELELKIETHDAEIRSLFKAIRQLMEPPPEPTRRQIGFHP